MQPVEIRISIGADGSVDVTREPSRGEWQPITPTPGAPGMYDVPHGMNAVNSAAFMQSPGRMSRGDRERLIVRIAKRMIANELERRGLSEKEAESEAERIGAGGWSGILAWLLENLPAILEALLKIFGGL